MTRSDLETWLKVTEETGTKIVLGPGPNRPKQIVITRNNLDELIRDGIIRVTQEEAA